MRSVLKFFVITLLPLFAVSGCSVGRPRLQVVGPVIHGDELNAAQDSAQFIMAHLHAYTGDELSRYETAEIAAVERDIRAARSETNTFLFIEEVRQMETDWDRLVGLDQMLEKERLA